MSYGILCRHPRCQSYADFKIVDVKDGFTSYSCLVHLPNGKDKEFTALTEQDHAGNQGLKNKEKNE